MQTKVTVIIDCPILFGTSSRLDERLYHEVKIDNDLLSCIPPDPELICKFIVGEITPGIEAIIRKGMNHANKN